MINFNKLKLVVNDKYSFVGIERKNTDLLMYLPKGFSKQINLLNTFEAKRDLFFLFYQIFNEFKQICIEKSYLEENSFVKGDRDGLLKINSGLEIDENSEEDEHIFYAKLDSINDLLKVYNEPKILSLVYRLGKSEITDFSKFYKFLHRAVFLPNGAAYLDEIDQPRKQITFQSTDIVAMYCYLVEEVKQQLNQEINPELKALAEQFKQNYLGGNYSLFDGQFYDQVINLLKDALEKIDHHTPFKDVDYWDFYEAIESFLYGELKQTDQGRIWGFKNFHTIWESMCLTYLLKNTDPKLLLYLDQTFLSNQLITNLNNQENKLLDLSNTFNINGSKLRPDVVLLRTLEKGTNPEDIIYKIGKDNWDDYGYKTTFRLYFNIENTDSINIAYFDQKIKNHTINELQKYYNINGSQLLIDHRLPDQFFSFWILDQFDYQCNFEEQLQAMCYFNHIFYLAIEQKIFTSRKLEKFLQPFGFNLDKRGFFDNFNVLTLSLFRNQSSNQIYKMFDEFIFYLSAKSKLFLEIIDIKYLEASYFQNNQNREDIKNRSVRKQFVYEYLLQKEIEKNKEIAQNLKIESSFWLPSYGQNSIIENDLTFMDGYINLAKIDFEKIAQSYIY